MIKDILAFLAVSFFLTAFLLAITVEKFPNPLTTILFCLVCLFIVVNTIFRYPVNTLIGIGILLSGIPVYYLWKRPRPA